MKTSLLSIHRFDDLVKFNYEGKMFILHVMTVGSNRKQVTLTPYAGGHGKSVHRWKYTKRVLETGRNSINF